MKLSSKVRNALGTVCFVLAALCVLAFLVGSVITRPASPERFMNKIEKICREKDKAKFIKLYDKKEKMTVEEAEIPFEEYDADFLFEEMQEVGKKQYRLVYTATYELDGNTYTYSGNELSVKKTFFGYKLLRQ